MQLMMWFAATRLGVKGLRAYRVFSVLGFLGLGFLEGFWLEGLLGLGLSVLGF